MRRAWAAALGVALAASALMARQVLGVGWVGHDSLPIVLTSRAASLADLVRISSRELMDGRYASDFYRPLYGLSVALDHALWGLEPVGYQVISLALFGVSGVVVFAVARRLLGGRALLGPLVAEIFYFVHPSNIEVVPVLARRPDLLCWVFLGTALALVLARPAKPAVLAGVAAFLAMMSKEPGLLAPALAVAAVVVLGGGVRAALRTTTPLWLALAVAVVTRFAVLGGLGGHGETVRGASVERIPAVLAAVWALLVEPQPVVAAGVVGSPWVVAWTVAFVAAVALGGFSRAATAAACWLLAFAALYALTGGIQAWYLLIPVACFAILLGAVVEAARRAPVRGRAALAVVAVLLVWQARYSPLWVRYDAWERATRASAEFREELDRRVALAPSGTTLKAPPLPYWVPVDPGRPSLRGASVLAPFSVRAWLDLRFPERTFRVTDDRGTRARGNEVVVEIDGLLPGFDADPR